MTIEVRQIRNEDEWSQYADVRNEAFHAPREMFLDNRHLFIQEETRCLFENGEMKAAGRLYAYEQHLHGRVLQMGGVASIATRLVERGRGHIRRIITAMMDEMREQGVPVSVLMPTVYAVYRRFGFDICAEKRVLTGSISRQLFRNPLEKKGTIRRVREEDFDVLCALYDQQARQSHGYIGRSESHWKHRILMIPYANKPRTGYLYFDEAGEPQAYLLYHRDDETLWIKDLVANTGEGLQALLELLQQDNLSKEWRLETQPESVLPTLFYDPRAVETKMLPFFMARIVDVTTAWQTVSEQAADGRVLLQVTDEMCKWNEGVWELNVEGGAGHAAPATGSAQASGDIAVWTQIFYGYLTVEQALFSGKLKVADQQAVPFLKKLWAVEKKPFMIDAF